MNPRTGANFAAGQTIPVWMPDPGQRFKCRYFTTNGTGWNNTAPTQAMIGDPCGLVYIADATYGTHWGVEHGTLDFGCGRIVDIIQASTGQSIQGTGFGVGTVSTTLLNGQIDYFIVFEILAHQGTPTAVTAPAA
jgi:hypothetical protein